MAKKLLAAKAKRYRRTEGYRKSYLKQRYNITLEEYHLLYDRQGGRCAICETDTPGGRFNTFHIDHCHKSGAVRGLLCSKCNLALGGFNDNPSTIAKALQYLLDNEQ